MKKFDDSTATDYDYFLPQDSIAQFPVDERALSRLLIVQDNKISEDIFSNIDQILESGDVIVMNNTRVLHARLLFRKENNVNVEIFVLTQDENNVNEVPLFQKKGFCELKCLVRNNKRWKSGKLFINKDGKSLSAQKVSHDKDNFIIRFEWQPVEHTFYEVLDNFGVLPLPPYIRREASEPDELRYQTVFASEQGSVAAPTAGLHFDYKMIEKLKINGITSGFVTLHVGAGTFKPIEKDIASHIMHAECFSVSRELLMTLCKKSRSEIIPVGTTSLRTLESLYWIGIKQIIKETDNIRLGQWEPYTIESREIPHHVAFGKLLDYMDKLGLKELRGITELMIKPGYDFKATGGLITNFHQPRSTLLLIVAALMGKDWKKIYNYAVTHKFRFLSYGDCCFFRP